MRGGPACAAELVAMARQENLIGIYDALRGLERLHPQRGGKRPRRFGVRTQQLGEAHGPGARSVPGQVQQLINDATDAKNLAQMFIWWLQWC